jgi:hypothetical protein
MPLSGEWQSNRVGLLLYSGGAMSNYSSEKALVDSFLASLRGARTPWHCAQISTEFFYQRGRADVVAVDIDGQIIAVEAKLEKWRVALHQAYRNTCFANLSYVLLPKSVAFHAHRFLSEFERRRVGICYVEANEAHILQPASVVHPLQPWLSGRAVESMLAGPTDDTSTA